MTSHCCSRPLSCYSDCSIVLPLATSTPHSGVNAGKPCSEKPQRSQSLQGRKDFFFCFPKSSLLQATGFFCENETARLIFGQEHFCVPCKGLVDFNWRLSLFSWSYGPLWFSFVKRPDMPKHLSSQPLKSFQYLFQIKPFCRLFFLLS